jgi:elongation factor G
MNTPTPILNPTLRNVSPGQPQDCRGSPLFSGMERTRNFGVAAHIDAGKTTLTERILFHTGAIHLMGEVHHGNTTTDFHSLEKAKGITITAAAVSCSWQDCRLNLIDTPGHVDFTAEVERSLRVLDGMVAVFCAVAGVQPQSETVWRQANKYGVPRLAFINKMDRTGADFARVTGELRRKLAANAWPIVLPLGAEDDLVGQIDVVSQRMLMPDAHGGLQTLPVAPEHVPAAKRALKELLEALAEIDEEIADAFLREQEVASATLRAAIRRQTLAGCFVPVVGGSAFKNVGIPPLLDAVVDYLPGPLDKTDAQVQQPGTGVSISLSADPLGPACALAFKLWSDRHKGRVVFVRVYSGALHPGDTLLNPRTGKCERVGRLLQLQADKERELEVCTAGDIAAVVGLKDVRTGDTLCTEGYPMLLEPPSFPEPVVSMAIEPKTRADQERLGAALTRLADEDPTFHVSADAETGQTLIAGMGELHLEIIREKLALDHGVEASTGQPRIAYRETITRAATGKGEQVKQSGGSGQFAKVTVQVAPRRRGEGNRIEDHTVGGAIPRQFLAACRKGVEEALQDGVLGGHPVVDVAVEIIDGQAHAKDSNELAFRMAAIFAVKDALRQAGAILLEPIMAVECVAPDEYRGDLLGDLNRRRGRILGVEEQVRGADSVEVTLQAEAPLAELFGYANAIRSLSRGRASYSMRPARFEPVPAKMT